jgi:mannose-6-phosphate isomerase-like protein (cupin superfamily)
MVRKSDEKNVAFKENLFQGMGGATVRSLLNGPEEMYGKGRVFAHTSLEPGCSIGYHVHKDESETYYICSGSAEFSDNGTLTVLSAGDVTFTGSGEGHGIRNIGTVPLHFIALILYK